MMEEGGGCEKTLSFSDLFEGWKLTLISKLYTADFCFNELESRDGPRANPQVLE